MYACIFKFSGTVNGPAQQEVSVSDAYDRLRQLVYSGSVAIQIVVPFQTDPVKKYCNSYSFVNFAIFNTQQRHYDEIALHHLKL